jgi:hypothetical protein
VAIELMQEKNTGFCDAILELLAVVDVADAARHQ